jgi:hypothetical protein
MNSTKDLAAKWRLDIEEVNNAYRRLFFSAAYLQLSSVSNFSSEYTVKVTEEDLQHYLTEKGLLAKTTLKLVSTGRPVSI